MSYGVDFELDAPLLRVAVTGGQRDPDLTLAAWRTIAAEVRRVAPEWLLVVSRLQGGAFTAEQARGLIEGVAGLGLECVRIAVVYPQAAGWSHVQGAEILAMEAGFDARVFPDEATALNWLRYGER